MDALAKTAAEAAAKLPFGDWWSFAAGAGALLFVMLVVRYFTPDRLLPHPKVKEALFAVPIIAGAVWGYGNWTGSAGATSGAVWGGVMGAAAHVEWWAIAFVVRLVNKYAESAATAWIGKKFGVELNNQAPQSDPGGGGVA